MGIVPTPDLSLTAPDTRKLTPVELQALYPGFATLEPQEPPPVSWVIHMLAGSILLGLFAALAALAWGWL